MPARFSVREYAARCFAGQSSYLNYFWLLFHPFLTLVWQCEVAENENDCQVYGCFLGDATHHPKRIKCRSGGRIKCRSGGRFRGWGSTDWFVQ
jgi:hypothetical protein